MALRQKLELRQSQALVMTPQLMQAIKLLQLSNLDLCGYVDGELERNPLLERSAEAEFDSERASDAPREDASERPLDVITATEAPQPAADVGAAEDARSDERPIAETALGYSEWGSVPASRRADSDHSFEAFVAAECTLADHLGQQLAVAVSDPARRMIGQYLIDSTDEAGYLTVELSSVAEKLGAPLAEVEAVLAVLQGFDPSGVCARSLTECLALQLKERDRLDPAMQALLAHLDLLARRDLAALRRLCGVDDEDLAEMIAELRRLNPKPGLAFGATAVQPVVPDIYVRPLPSGAFHVELNTDTLPRVLVNQRYYTQVTRSAKSDQEKSYLADCLQSATWLIRALDQRARTILKVAEEIVRQQDGFFAYGVQHLRPLNLKTVAEALGMHESTVSRVTANKYMATSRGIFELKYFFTAAIASTDGGEAHSAAAVRHRIKQLIDGESGEDVLSDDTIVEKLKALGIEIARRTVAKYREAMRIPSSVQRRREKQLAGNASS
ncbi:MAG: RNA polymerase factor sigma-54 [Hyphomicrobiales bacterium]|nr:RNA polymerase factor sigma-54 [Hyphomicrobiales bacterium]